MSVAETVLQILSDIAATDEVRDNPDLRLFDLAVLDSLKTVELIVALSEAFGMEISPAELDREQWATPQRIVSYIEQRVGA
jgi:D-alanine--poly(phosphoribitol) ligase subunit 2